MMESGNSFRFETKGFGKVESTNCGIKPFRQVLLALDGEKCL